MWTFGSPAPPASRCEGPEAVQDETDRHVRSYLARTGGRKGDLSRFVDRAVRQAIFWEALESIWERNRNLSDEDIQRLADEAIVQTRAYRS